MAEDRSITNADRPTRRGAESLDKVVCMLLIRFWQLRLECDLSTFT